MPLSEHEQRLLEQMERALYAEDPKFASSLRSAVPRPGGRRAAIIGVLATIVGVGLLVTGAATAIVAVGVLGFLVMLGGTFLVIPSLRPKAEPAAPAPGTRPAARTSAKSSKTGFMDRVEERFRKRRDGEGG